MGSHAIRIMNERVHVKVPRLCASVSQTSAASYGHRQVAVGASIHAAASDGIVACELLAAQAKQQSRNNPIDRIFDDIILPQVLTVLTRLARSSVRHRRRNVMSMSALCLRDRNLYIWPYYERTNYSVGPFNSYVLL